MNSFHFSIFLYSPQPSFHHSPHPRPRPRPPLLQLKPHRHHHHHHHHHLSSSRPSILSHCTSQTTEEGPVSVVSFEELIEKDWSFIDSPNTLTSLELYNQKVDQIISAGKIEEHSRVLVSIGSEEFVDRVVESSKCELVLVVHDSLFVLAGIKEKHDKIKCWQGEILYVPEKWAPFDVVFLYYLPGLPFELPQVFEVISRHCSPGSRLIISHPQGREVVEKQRKEYPDVAVSDLPDKMTLENVAADYSFDVTKFVDEPGFYLAVLKDCKAASSD